MYRFPPPLAKGGTVAIISPATRVKAEYVHSAAQRIEQAGYKVRIMPHALATPSGSYAASVSDRLADFKQAWCDPEVDAILCSRGGYGCVHLLDDLTDDLLLSSPKWLIGFSDVSALHARLLKAGIASVHGSMAKYIADEAIGDKVLESLLQIITSPYPSMHYELAAGDNSCTGMARGTLKGGNLAVLSHLIGTRYDIFSGDSDILFIEDVSEAIYASERMLWQLRQCGALDRAAGLVIGSFTETQADLNFHDSHAMIYSRLKEWGYTKRMPIAFNFPVGHIADNQPLIEGAQVELCVSSGRTILKTIN